MARAAARQISFADVELIRQGVRLEPVLAAICGFLDKQREMIERVRRDLARGLKQPARGRRGLTTFEWGMINGKLSALLGNETDLASRRALMAANFELADLTDKVGLKE